MSSPRSGNHNGRRLPMLALAAGEWLLLAGWTLFLLRTYLNLDPTVIPSGHEFLSSIYAHFMWDDAKACGACAMWFGHARGGYPAFVDPHEAMLHPVVIVTTLIWGPVNGAKMAIVVLFFLAGIGQWLTARVLGLGIVARLWSGAMAIAAGNLSGRMEDGVFGLIASASAFAFVLPAIILLSQWGNRRSAGLLGIALGIFLLSGQAYLQIGFLMLSPLVLILVTRRDLGTALLVRRLVLAGVIALLVASPLLVPFLHFSSHFDKEITANYTEAQPARWAPLNLVISDPDYYRSARRGMHPYPYLYTIYIGWIAVLFAAIGFAVMWSRGLRRLAFFLALFAAGAIFISGATPFRWIRDFTPDQSSLHDFVLGIRHSSLISGLAVPVLLTAAAIGLDAVVRWRPASNRFAVVNLPTYRPLVIAIRCLIVVPLFVSLRSAREFDQHWLIVTTQQVAEIDAVTAALKTDDLQWVDTPYGEIYFIGRAMNQGLKLSSNVTVWTWRGRKDPIPILMARRGDQPPDTTRETTAAGIPIYRSTVALPYAHLRFDDGTIADCTAHGRGGNIDVSCDTERPGMLVVQENHGSGWTATLNGSSAAVVEGEGRWLGVEVEPGHLIIHLRYRPWDVPLGIGLMCLGLALAAFLIWQPGMAKDPEISPETR